MMVRWGMGRGEAKSMVLLRGHDFATRVIEPRIADVIYPASAERSFWIDSLEAAAVFEEQATAILNAYREVITVFRIPYRRHDLPVAFK